MLAPFIDKPDFSSDLIIFIISFISSLEIVNVVCFAKSVQYIPDPKTFLWVDASVTDAAAVNPDDIKMILANGLSAFPVKDNPAFSDSSKSLPKNPYDCHILCNWVFNNFILAKESFAKALQSLKTFVLVNDNLWGKLFPSLESPTTSDEIWKFAIFYS